MQQYRYKPLRHPDAEIRVAALQPGAYDDEIYLSFRVTRIRGDATRGISTSERADVAPTGDDEWFEYEALSYAWGAPDFHSHVVVHGREEQPETINIGQNLDVAIRHLRHEKVERLVWIDAICINQSDDIEKGVQVAMMSKVYSLASSVIAWIGPEKDQSGEALAMMQNWADQIEVDWETRSIGPREGSEEPHWADLQSILPYKDGELDPIHFLLQRPYFE